MVTLSMEEMHRIKEWYDAISDINPGYLEEPDRALFEKISDAMTEGDARRKKFTRRVGRKTGARNIGQIVEEIEAAFSEAVEKNIPVEIDRRPFLCYHLAPICYEVVTCAMPNGELKMETKPR